MWIGRAFLIALAVAAAADNRIAARRAERRRPPRGQFVTVDGVRLHYIERGSGAPVLLLHGNGANAEDFVLSGLFGRLARSHRVVAFDRPGFGHSPRPRGRFWNARAQAHIIGKAAREIGLERPVVLGHSWGTLVALELALDRPDRVAGLVLLAGFYFPVWRWDVAAISIAALPGLGAFLCSTILPAVGRVSLPRIVTRIFAPEEVPASFSAGFSARLALRPSQLRAAAADTAWMTLAAARILPRLNALAMPVAILAGTEDRIVDTARHPCFLHRALPGSRLLLQPGAGHMIHYSASDMVAEAVEAVGAEATARAIC